MVTGDAISTSCLVPSAVLYASLGALIVRRAGNPSAGTCSSRALPPAWSACSPLRRARHRHPGTCRDPRSGRGAGRVVVHAAHLGASPSCSCSSRPGTCHRRRWRARRRRVPPDHRADLGRIPRAGRQGARCPAPAASRSRSGIRSASGPLPGRAVGGAAPDHQPGLVRVHRACWPPPRWPWSSATGRAAANCGSRSSGSRSPRPRDRCALWYWRRRICGGPHWSALTVLRTAVVTAIGLAGFPIVIAIAILKYGLYQIDVIISQGR